MFYPHTPGLTLDPPGESLEETYFDVAGRRVHGWVAWPAPGTELPGGVVVVPGLGLPQYTFPTARALADLGLRCTVLDLPGFGSARADAGRPDGGARRAGPAT